jgi:NADH-quinone oxidoreductase subunit G
LVVGGVEVDDLPDPDGARAALDAVPFLVSLEIRHSEVTERADVVLPVAAPAEKAGTFIDWEGRERPFPAVLRVPTVMTDARVLNALADAMNVWLGLPDVPTVRRELAALGQWAGPRRPGPALAATPPPSRATDDQLVLATWRMMLDAGRGQDGEPFLAGTARRPVARLSPATARSLGGIDGGPVTVATQRGSVTLPLVITEMCDGVVWLPGNSNGSTVHNSLAAAPGDLVRVGIGAVS